MKSFITESYDETLRLGRQLAQALDKEELVLLRGELGAGKTALIQGLAAGLGVTDDVCSPTYTLMNIYQGTELTVYHFDLYRLNSVDEIIEAGFDEYFYSDGICMVEWPEKLDAFSFTKYIDIALVTKGENERAITISLNGIDETAFWKRSGV